MGGDLSHKTVLLESAVEALLSDVDGVYIDATFGRGGHTRLLLERLSQSGRVIGIDKDDEAIKVGRELALEDERFSIFHGSFAEVNQLLDKGKRVSGVIADLGVSSPQLDDPQRGFSFQHDGPLDMRMDQTKGQTAAQWLAQVSESELSRVLKVYGEERFAKRVARRIVEAREEAPLQTTAQLAELVSAAIPHRERNKHPATRAFQAIRIAINSELDDLKNFLERAAELLTQGGRLVVISFHSLEDRLVKQFMRNVVRGEQLPRHLPIRHSEQVSDFRLATKAIKPSDDEVQENTRARSAIMRSLERVTHA